MNILVIAATRFELSLITGYIKSRKNNKPHHVQTLVTGVGILLSTHQLMHYLQQQNIDFVVQVGIGGGFDKKIPLGTVFSVMQDTVADMGVEEDKALKSVFDLGFIKRNQKPFSNGWLINKSTEFKKLPLCIAKGITVNKITTSSKMIKLYRDKYLPDIESMEGAALHYVCLMAGVKFMQLRASSNYIGERNKTKWKIQEAIENVNKVCIEIVNHLIL